MRRRRNMHRIARLPGTFPAAHRRCQGPGKTGFPVKFIPWLGACREVTANSTLQAKPQPASLAASEFVKSRGLWVAATSRIDVCSRHSLLVGDQAANLK